MSCNQTCNDCQCKRLNAVNIFSRDYKRGVQVGSRLQRDRTFDALIELESRNIISNAQMQAVFDLILEKLTDAVDID